MERGREDFAGLCRCAELHILQSKVAKIDVESERTKHGQVSDCRQNTRFSFDRFLSQWLSLFTFTQLYRFLPKEASKAECSLSSSLPMSHMFALAFWRCPDFAGHGLHGQAPWSAAHLMFADCRRTCRVLSPGFSLARLFIGSGGLSQYLKFMSFSGQIL